MATVNKYRTIYDVLFTNKNIFLDTFMLGFSVVFLAIMANLTVPLWPVPITMQTFGVFLIAFFFGSKRGLVSILTYVFAGIMGFGVFAGHKSGIAAVLGPTAGYIFGFLITVFIVGYLIEKGHGRSKKSVFLIMVLGSVIIYIFGLIGLKLNFVDFSFFKLLSVGVVPFLIGDALKIIIAVALFPYLWKGSDKISS
ncbi:MAG: biotin transporter BioY [Nanoarchaeota archaeon]